MNWELKQLFEIDKELQDSDYKIEDIKNALNNIYETFEGYFGIKTEMDEWNLDENGDVIEHNHRQCENFYYSMQNRIYKILIEKEYKSLSFLNSSNNLKK